MKVGMIQSNYIPWRGYFDFIDDVDVFVFYDDVQYTHKDWRNRNRIKTPGGPIWLSVPVIHDRSTLVEEAMIDYRNRWVDKHIRSVTLAYGNAAHFRRYAGEYFDILSTRLPTISQVNVALCKWILRQLDIRTETRMSSEFGLRGSKFDKPLELLRKIGATAYLAGPAARPYTDLQRFRESGIRLEFKTYCYPEYPQLHGGFVGAVTVLDLLFNTGSEARHYLKSLAPNEVVVE